MSFETIELAKEDNVAFLKLNRPNVLNAVNEENLEALLNNPQENSLSLKLRYYLDYQYLKRK